MTKQPVHTAAGPLQNAPYTPAVKVGNLVFVSGQVPIDPKTSRVVSGGFDEQAHQVLANLKALLELSGSSLDDVVKTTVFLSDLNHFAALNKIYGPYFGGVKPARSCIQAARLPLDVLIEIEAIAVTTPPKLEALDPV